MFKKLFSRGSIGSLSLDNRIVMTAMGNALAAEDGSVTEAEIAFYARRAQGGVGLIITECIIIDWESGRGNPHQTAAHNDAMIPGLTRLADAVHGQGAAIVGQLYHPGRQGHVELNGVDSMPAPSALADAMTQQPVHAMDREEIAALIAAFVEAALRLQKAGFDGVEIHGAHGYLLNSFLSPYSNLREDEYGGSTAGRTRLVREVIEAIRTACGPEFALLVRISSDEYLDRVGKPGLGIDLDEGVRIARELEAAGCDAIDVSSGIYETMNTAWEPFPYEEGWKAHLAAAIKEALSIPVIGVCVIRNPAFAEALLDEGKVDFVGSARAHFADPDWSDKARAGNLASTRRCVSCLACMETLIASETTAQPAGCAINPQTGRERLAPPVEAKGRRVVVVGAGPSGLEAAITAAKRGCEVCLIEKADVIGGQLNYASKPPGKEKILWLLDFYAERIASLGIDLSLGTEAQPQLLEALAPDALIVAAGSVPVLPASIPGLDQNLVHLPPAILTGAVDLSGQRVAVIGSGMTGIETTEFLAQAGCELALYEMAPDIGPGVYFQNLMDIMPRLGAHGVRLFPSHRLLSIEGQRARFEDANAEIVEESFDAFVVSLGMRPAAEALNAIRKVFPAAVAVGDSTKPGRII
ncbi:MAG: FAD-dependent oxidoreductase, partial [Coriobacteriales bacterium]|nr:FAD-dependent oxidoreductase [Coriobacteriales bacterium]